MEGCGGTQLGTCVGLYNLVSGFQVLGGISGYHVVRNVGGRIIHGSRRFDNFDCESSCFQLSLCTAV